MERIRFAHFVAKRRAMVGKSQKQLADELSYTPQAVSRFETLNSGFPLEFIPNLCFSLDCSIADLANRNLDNPHYEAVDKAFLDRLPEYLTGARNKAGLTQQDLAATLQITERSIRKYEKGESLPSYQLLESIADALGVEVNYFFTEIKPEVNLEEMVEVAPSFLKKNKTGFVAIFSIFATLLLGLSIAIPIALSARANNNNEIVSSATTLSDSSEPFITPLRLSFSQDKYEFGSEGDAIMLNVAYDDTGNYSNILQGDHDISITFDKEYESYVQFDFVVVDAHHISATLHRATRAYSILASITIDDETFDDVFRFKVPTSMPVRVFQEVEETFTDAKVNVADVPVLSNEKWFAASVNYLDASGNTVVFSSLPYAAMYELEYSSETVNYRSESKTVVHSLKRSKASNYFNLGSSGYEQVIFSYKGGLPNGVYYLWIRMPVYEANAVADSYMFCMRPLKIVIENQDESEENQYPEMLEVIGDNSAFTYVGETREYQIIDPVGQMNFEEVPESFQPRLSVIEGPVEPGKHPSPFAITKLGVDRFQVTMNGEARNGEGIFAMLYAFDQEYGGFAAFYYDDTQPVKMCQENGPGIEFLDAYFVCTSHPTHQARRGEMIDFSLRLTVMENGEKKDIACKPEDESMYGLSGGEAFPYFYNTEWHGHGTNWPGQNGFYLSRREDLNSPNRYYTPSCWIGVSIGDEWHFFRIRPVTIEFIG